LEIGATDDVLRSLRIIKGAYPESKQNPPIIQQIRSQLDEYFAGKRKRFEIPLLTQGTEFQKQVWEELQNIPYGKTISYAQLAQAVDRPKACRAVGSANGRNRIAIIIPCHRVIASDGTLGGYAYGLEIKKKLLDLENKICDKEL
jgi:methylated-DNA-[protein]-cysteine S-methyltransferase